MHGRRGWKWRAPDIAVKVVSEPLGGRVAALEGGNRLCDLHSVQLYPYCTRKCGKEAHDVAKIASD